MDLVHTKIKKYKKVMDPNIKMALTTISSYDHLNIKIDGGDQIITF